MTDLQDYITRVDTEVYLNERTGYGSTPELVQNGLTHRNVRHAGHSIRDDYYSCRGKNVCFTNQTLLNGIKYKLYLFKNSTIYDYFLKQ